MDSFWSLFRWGILPLLFVPIVLSLWNPDEDFKTMQIPQAPSQSDYYIRNARTSFMGTDGRLNYQIRASEITHYPDNSARMKQLQVHYTGTQHQVWQLTAKQGYAPVRQAGEEPQIILSSGVQILGERTTTDGSAGSLISMVTDKATIYPKSSRLETSAKVQFREHGLSADAEGLVADIKNGLVTLTGKVKVLYGQ